MCLAESRAPDCRAIARRRPGNLAPDGRGTSRIDLAIDGSWPTCRAVNCSWTTLNGPDVTQLALTDAEILHGGRGGSRCAGTRTDGDRAAHAPRARPGRSTDTSTCCAATLRRSALAGVKVVGDYVDNYQPRTAVRNGPAQPVRPGDRRSPSRSSTPPALPTCAPAPSRRIGAKHLARARQRILGHIGARGTAYWNVRLLDQLFDFDEIRVHSRRPDKPRRIRRTPPPRSRQASDRDR